MPAVEPREFLDALDTLEAREQVALHLELLELVQGPERSD